jgi:hypothetical protein
MSTRLENALIGTIDYPCGLFILSFFKDLLSSSPSNGTIELKAITNARRLYTSCTNEKAIETEGVNVILAFINTELGGWPVLQGSTWNESTFDFAHLMLKLSQHNNFILYTVKTNIDEKNSSVRSIRVRLRIVRIINDEYLSFRSVQLILVRKT